METGILLESGTNELEILEFRVGKNLYGINVAKVREILSYQDPTPVPNADARIEGIFRSSPLLILHDVWAWFVMSRQRTTICT